MRGTITILILFFMTTAAFASYDEALKLYQEGKYRESLKILAADLETADDFKAGSPNYQIRFLAAHNHWKLKSGEPVILHLRRCMEIKKDAVEPYIDLSMYLLDQRRWTDAAAWAERGLKIKQDPLLYYIMGCANRGKGNLARAKELLEKCNSLNPELYYSYNELGITLMRMGRYGEANTAFSVAGALRPDDARVLNNLALSFEKLGKVKEALDAATKAAAIDESDQAIAANVKRLREAAR